MHTEAWECVQQAVGDRHAPCLTQNQLPAPHRRFFDALASGSAGAADIAVLVRHVLGFESVRQGDDFGLSVRPGGAAGDDSIWRSAGVIYTRLADGRLHLQRRQWVPPGDDTAHLRGDPLHHVYLETKSPLCRRPDPVPADPFWMATVGYNDYRSEGQRQAARSIVTAPPGSTILVSLPTGTGKSSLVFAPALLASQAIGVSVVVVPTVVLALDQERRLQEMIKEGRERPSPSGRYAYVGDMADEEKEAIRSAIRRGEQRMLFTSPEALMTSLAPALHSAAQAGHLRFFVVDEAHIVDQWGADFRPDFQAMTGLRRRLVDQSAPDVAPVTVLMTGTLSPSAAETLYRLFADENSSADDRPFRIVSSSRLRSEPEYFVSCWPNDERRMEALREHLLHLPRPAVVYVSLPEQVDQVRQAMTAWGFHRHAGVSGRSRASERREVVNGWRMGTGVTRYDIVVATSAFGLGVDVPDVRAVIHACEPETVDRFYQEVGRGGRDGCPSVSCLLLTGSDRKIARRLGSPKLLRQKAEGRWDALLVGARQLPSMRLRLDLDTRPPNVTMEGPTNRRWNVALLSALARTSVLDLVASGWGEAQEEVTLDQAEVRRYLEISRRREINWAAYLTERQRILDASRDGLNALNVIESGRRCVGDVLRDWYSFDRRFGSARVTRSCRGCPACRRAQVLPSEGLAPLPPVADWPDPTSGTSPLHALMPHGRLTVLLDTGDEVAPARLARRVLKQLVVAGFHHVLDVDGGITEREWLDLQDIAGPRPLIRSITAPSPLDPPVPTVAMLVADTKPPVDLADWFDYYPALVLVAPANLTAPGRPDVAWSDLHQPCVTHTRLCEDL
ncbi:protein DpdF [Micromonospora echinofusca]|uniref:protein DpdF n=1 Tax=Micromonospora echinofusca TaxID=47858 RepID=UPI003720BDFF